MVQWSPLWNNLKCHSPSLWKCHQLKDIVRQRTSWRRNKLQGWWPHQCPLLLHVQERRPPHGSTFPATLVQPSEADVEMDRQGPSPDRQEWENLEGGQFAPLSPRPEGWSPTDSMRDDTPTTSPADIADLPATPPLPPLNSPRTPGDAVVSTQTMLQGMLEQMSQGFNSVTANITNVQVEMRTGLAALGNRVQALESGTTTTAQADEAPRVDRAAATSHGKATMEAAAAPGAVQGGGGGNEGAQLTYIGTPRIALAPCENNMQPPQLEREKDVKGAWRLLHERGQTPMQQDRH